MVLGIPGAVIAGTVSHFAGREKVSAKIVEKFETVKDKYKKFSFSDSVKQFRVQVR